MCRARDAALWLVWIPTSLCSQGFQQPVTIPVSRTGLNPTYVVSADFDRDGIPDLATANVGPPLGGSAPRASIGVVLGARSAGLGAFTELPVPGLPFELLTLDVNRDGAPDIVATMGRINSPGGQICSYLGNGRGGFGNPVCSDMGSVPGRAVGADFNRDGAGDLAVIRGMDSNVVTFLGVGDGTFRLASSIPVALPTTLATADYNGDGVSDLFIHSGSGLLSVAQGDRQGGLRVVQTLPASPGPSFLASADLNRDGRPDLIFASLQAQTLSIYPSNASGLATPRVVSLPVAPGFLQLVDGDIWLATSAGLLPYFNDGTGGFGPGPGPPVPVVTGSLGPFVLGDFNGDFLLDIAGIGFDSSGGRLALYAGRLLTTILVVEPSPASIVFGAPGGLTAHLCATPEAGPVPRSIAGAEVQLLRGSETVEIARLRPPGAPISLPGCIPGFEIGTATFTGLLAPGDYTLAAFFPGSGGYSASTSAPVRLTVLPAPSFINLPPAGLVIPDRERPILAPILITSGATPVIGGIARLTVGGNVLAETAVKAGVAMFELPGGLPVGPLRARVSFESANYLPSESAEFTMVVTSRPVVSSAAWPSNSAIAPDSLAVITLPGLLADEQQKAPGGIVVEMGPNPLGNAKVVSVSPERIQILVPPVAPGTYTVRVLATGEMVGLAVVSVSAVAPAIFTADQSGSGPPSATAELRRADGSSQPVTVFDCASGECVAVPMPLGGDGDNLLLTLAATGLRGAAVVSCSAGFIRLEVVSFGADPAREGVDQVVVRIRRGDVSGPFPLVLSADGVLSNTVRLAAVN